MCSCKEDIVVYYCNDLQCPNNQTNPMYCVICQGDYDKHKHKCSLIFDKITELDSAWNTQKEAFNRITTGATQRYSDLEVLINYF